jgi:hypothetical protein
MCDVPSVAVFCSESIECFPGIVSKFFLKLLLLLLLLLLFVITFMQGIYNHILETNHVSVLLRLQFMVHVKIFSMLKPSVPLHLHFRQQVRSDQYGRFLFFLDFVLFR